MEENSSQRQDQHNGQNVKHCALGGSGECQYEVYRLLALPFKPNDSRPRSQITTATRSVMPKAKLIFAFALIATTREDRFDLDTCLLPVLAEECVLRVLPVRTDCVLPLLLEAAREP